MSLSKGAKIAIAVVVIVVVAAVVYSLVPYGVATPVKDLKSNQTAYIYGTVQGRVSIGNFSAFKLNDSSGSVIVVWNGSLPADGSKVLVHGTYRELTPLLSGLSYFEADSVLNWPI